MAGLWEKLKKEAPNTTTDGINGAPAPAQPAPAAAPPAPGGFKFAFPAAEGAPAPEAPPAVTPAAPAPLAPATVVTYQAPLPSPVDQVDPQGPYAPDSEGRLEVHTQAGPMRVRPRSAVTVAGVLCEELAVALLGAAARLG